MTLLVSDVVTSARGTLIDAAKVAWPDAQLIAYVNEGVEKTCFVKPDAYTVYEFLGLTAGAVQQLDADVVAVLDIVRTANAGAAVTQVDKALLEAADPLYTNRTGTLDIEHYMVDPRSPRTFLVYPPAATGAGVTAMLAKRPPSVTALGDTFPLAEVYLPVILDYVLARAYAKNSKRQDLTKTSYHMQQWATALGLKAQAQILASPKIADGTPT